MERPKTQIEYPANVEHKIAGSLTAIEQLTQDLKEVINLRIQAESAGDETQVATLAQQEAKLLDALDKHKVAIEKLK
jgi:hypothetical protein